MSVEPLRIDALLESVADGSDVDWDALDAAAATDQERRMVRHLRLVAGIADVHRTIPLDDEPEPVPALVPDTREMPRWGHLLLLDKIGEGTFGEVYRARDPWLDREVALKLLRSTVTGPGRIVSEGQALARVRHPNVVMVHGADMHEGRAGLWMEFVRGRTLSEIVATDGPMSAAEAAIAGQELCRALSAVHGAGLVHRDVKAQNVMRESGGRLVLMDFGAGHTPLYLAPELLNHESPASASSDIYALGVLLYFLVTGTYPVRGASLEELERAHANGARRRLGDARPDLPDLFVSVVERAMHPDPAQRFATAREMREALARATSIGTARMPALTAPPPAVVPPVPRWRKPAIAAAATFAVVATLAYVWDHRPSAPVAHASVQLVAVLPLKALGGTEAYMAAGLTEGLTQELSMSGPLKVASTTSVDRLVADRTPLSKLAETLTADAVIEGAVSQSSDRVSVNIRVIHAGTDTAAWARTFERGVDEISTIQREIARAIVDEFRVAVNAETIERWQSPAQINPAAYDEYMRGRNEYRRMSQPGVEGAVKHLERAVSIEPRYARANASLAQAYYLLGRLGSLPRDTATRQAREAAARALRIDDAVPDAHSVLARLEADAWNFGEAEKRYRRAIALDPSFVEPRLAFASFLAGRGRFDESFAQLSMARRVDPLSADVADRTAVVYYYARRYADALTEAQRALQIDPENIGTQAGLVRILNAMGRYDEALARAERAAAGSANYPGFQVEMALADIGSGRQANARRRIATLVSPQREPQPRVTPMSLAVAYAPLDRDEAFRWLRREFDSRSPGVLWVKVDPRMDPLRKDPRFRELLKRVQLEP
jgi:eukaryotic-like serine/threonine-protein kinase